MLKPIYLFSINSHPDAIHINSLDITFFKPEIDFSKYDALIITSKQASKALTQYDNADYLHLPALAVSRQSAQSYEKLGGKILEIGEGYGDNLVEKIKSYSKDKKWLYLRAETVASDFVDVCRQEGHKIDELVLYRSACSDAIGCVNVEDNAILIFTSPSSVKCYLKDHILSKEQLVIVIGKTTAKALPEDVEYILSTETTIESCMAIAKEHI
ncbi:uroporphyrinogen-III synthase [Sulfurimonas sp.]